MKNKTIGYTSGVYDLFHVGHLNILKRAKEQCDYLIVSVSTDELVQKYKNKTPIIDFESRKKIIESIKYVDEVVPQINRDKMQAFHQYKFDKIFVGNDWKGSELWDNLESQLKQFNAEVVYIDYTRGISTTEILNKLKDNE